MNEMREIERRKLNITEGLILASLLGLGALIFRLNDSVTRPEVTTDGMNRQLTALQAQLADVPALAQRVSRNEVRVEALEDQFDEIKRRPTK